MPKVIKLPKASRIKPEKVAIVREIIADIEMPSETRAVLDNALYSVSDIPGARSVFVMISIDQFRYVTQKIADGPDAGKTLMVWNAAITYVRQDTGEILASRDKLAEDARTNPDEISRAMTELTKIGAILKERRGRNVVYKVNPHVAWNGGEGARIAAAKTAPKLYAIDGGKADPGVSEDTVTAAIRFLMLEDAPTRIKWAARAVELGAKESPAMPAKENVKKWARKVAAELVRDGLIKAE